MSGYQTLVVDPPWPQAAGGPLRGREGFGDTTGSLPMPYRTMSVEGIAALPVGSVVAPASHLYPWTTNRFLADAFAVMTAWGFTYSTTLVWAKTPMGGGLGGAYGISTEYVLFGRRGKLATAGRVRGTWFNWKRPYDSRGKPQHSTKPPEFYEMVQTVSPGPYLELFARRPRDGWDVWGDQAPGAVALPALEVAA